MDNATVGAYANHGADRSPDLTSLARAIKEWEIALGCTAVALRIAGRDNAVAGAPPRSPLRASGGDPYPDREPHSRFRAQVEARCRHLDVDTMATDDSGNASGPTSRSPSASFVPKGRDGAGCPRASRRTSHGRSGFPDLAHSGWHCALPAPPPSLWTVGAASQFPSEMKRMSIGSRCMWSVTRRGYFRRSRKE